MQKNATIREKLFAKDSNLGSLLIQSAMNKSKKTYGALNPISEGENEDEDSFTKVEHIHVVDGTHL